MTQFTDNIEEELGIGYDPAAETNTAVATVSTKPVVEEYIDTTKTKNDFSDVTDSLKELVDQGKTAVNKLMKIAQESENPRAYEVVSKLIKDTSEAAQRIMDSHKIMTEVEVLSKTKLNSSSGGGVNIERAIFTGTTKELLALAKGKKQQ